MKIIEAAGASIPAVGLGTWKLKGAECSEIVREALSCGYRHIDTARMYGNEAEVGAGIAESGIARDEIFLTTKIWWTDLSRDAFAGSVREALSALRQDHVDLLLIHWPNGEIPLDESIEALNAAVTAGQARHIGVANFPSALFEEAARLSPAPLVCNQVEHHPLMSQRDVHGAALKRGAAMIGYCPIGQGGALLARDEITAMAGAHGKTPAQIVLRWAVEKENVGAIPKTGNPQRLRENIDIFDFELTTAERETLDALSDSRQRLVDPSWAPDWDVA